MQRSPSVIYVLSALLVLAVTPHGYTQSTSGSPQGQATDEQVSVAVQDANTELDTVARMIAESLSQPGFRGLVRSEVAQSKNREHIVELAGFLERAARRGGASRSTKELSEHVGRVSGRVKQLRVWDREGFDLYFPVKEHLRKWKGDADLFVAYAPFGDEAGVDEIYAYSVADGGRYALDRNSPPNTPVMVVAPCEHSNHELTETPKGKVPALLEERGTGVGASPRKIGDAGFMERGMVEFDGTIEPTVLSAEQLSEAFLESYGNYGSADRLMVQFMKLDMNPPQDHEELAAIRRREIIWISSMKVYDTHEEWWNGAPEIYVFYADARADREHPARVYAQPLSDLVDVAYLDHRDTWYETPQLAYLSDVYCTDEGVLRVMERDGGYIKAFSHKIWETNTSVAFIGFSSDDTIGTLRIRKSRYEYGRTYGEYYNNGFRIALMKTRW